MLSEEGEYPEACRVVALDHPSHERVELVAKVRPVRAEHRRQFIAGRGDGSGQQFLERHGVPPASGEQILAERLNSSLLTALSLGSVIAGRPQSDSSMVRAEAFA